jgi:hypothetical protein
LANWNRKAGTKRTGQKLRDRQEIPIPCEVGNARLLLNKYETYWKGFIQFTPDGVERSTAGEIYVNFGRGPAEIFPRCLDRFLEELGTDTDGAKS